MGISVQDDMMFIIKSYLKSLHDMGQCFSKRFCSLWMNNEHIYKLTNTGKIEDETVKNLHHLTTTIVNNRKKLYNKNMIGDETDGDEGSRKYAMLDLLLKHEKEGLIDIDDVRQEVDTFIFAVSVANNCYHHHFFHYDIASKVFSSSIQHAIFPEIGGKLGTECLCRTLSPLCYLAVCGLQHEDICIYIIYIHINYEYILINLLNLLNFRVTTRPQYTQHLCY